MTTERPPDHPPVPRSPRSIFAYVIAALVVAIVVGYSAVAYTQAEFGEPERDTIPASVRTSPGGYRSYHFWHSGYHGGK